MNTQSHVLLGAALFSGRGIGGRGLAAVVGSLAPDFPLFVLFGAARLAGNSNSEFFRVIYWQEPIPTIMGASHSFIVWGAVFAAGLWLWRRQGDVRFFGAEAAPPRAIGTGEALSIAAAAGLLHALADFALHRDDAHMQFWPLTDWRFRSPVSYWDGNHYGDYWSLAEAAIGIACAVVLWRRFPSLWVRTACGAAILMYVAVPAYFIHSIV